MKTLLCATALATLLPLTALAMPVALPSAEAESRTPAALEPVAETRPPLWWLLGTDADSDEEDADDEEDDNDEDEDDSDKDDDNDSDDDGEDA
jgi:hypothetical protein